MTAQKDTFIEYRLDYIENGEKQVMYHAMLSKILRFVRNESLRDYSIYGLTTKDEWKLLMKIGKWTHKKRRVKTLLFYFLYSSKNISKIACITGTHIELPANATCLFHNILVDKSLSISSSLTPIKR